MAAEFALLVVKADIRGVFTLQTELTTDFVKSRDLFFGKFLRTAEKTGVEEKFRIEFNGFHLVVSVEKRIGIRQRAMVREKYGVEILKVFSTASGISSVDGVPYSAMGTQPSAITASGIMG